MTHGAKIVFSYLFWKFINFKYSFKCVFFYS